METIKKLFPKLLFLQAIVFVSGLFFLDNAHAADLLPKQLQDLLKLLGPQGQGASEYTGSRVRSFLLLGLGVIILFAVVYTALAAFRYIRSQGDEGEVQGAQKGVQAIFQGLAIMLIAIVGIVLVFVIFGVDFFGTQTYQVCVAAPNSPGCQSCQADGKTVTAMDLLDKAAGGSGAASTGGLYDQWDTIKFSTKLDDVDAAVKALPTQTVNKSACTFCEYEYYHQSKNSGALSPAGEKMDIGKITGVTSARFQEICQEK